MNIHENTALLDAFLDGELTLEEQSAVEAHLADCADCRAYVDDGLAIRAAFPTEETAELPADLKEHVMAAVANAPQSRPKKQPWGKLAAAAACLAVIVLVQHGAGSNADTANSAVYAADQAVAEMAVQESASLERNVEAPAATEQLPAETESAKSVSLTEEDTQEDALDEAPAVSGATALLVVQLIDAEAGDLLADFTPEEVMPGYARYLLSREEFDTLAAQLSERDIPLEVDDDTAAQIWVELLCE